MSDTESEAGSDARSDADYFSDSNRERIATHVYCALCGVTAGRLELEDEGPDEEYLYDLEIIADHQLKWLRSVKLIGENPFSPSTKKAFVADAVRCRDDGWFTVSADFPFPTGCKSDSIQVYRWDLEYPVFIPIHAACYKIFEKVVAPNKVDVQALYDALKKQVPKERPGAERIQVINWNFGECEAEVRGREFITKEGEEDLVASPTEIPGIEECLQGLLSRCDSESRMPMGSPVPIASGSSQNGMLATLPKETLYDILMHLDDDDLNNTRLAYRAAAVMTYSQTFWRERVFVKQPWISEFLLAADTSGVDWLLVYLLTEHILSRKFEQGYDEEDIANDEEKGRWNIPDLIPILHLENRERIWESCREMYLHAMKVKAEAPPRPELKAAFLHDVEMTPLVPLSVPPYSDHGLHLTMAPFLNSFNDLQDAQPIIIVHRHKNASFLAGIEVWCSETFESVQIGSEIRQFQRPGFKTAEIQIPPGDWLAAVIFTGSENPLNRHPDFGGDEKDYSFVVKGVKFIFLRSPSVQIGETEGEHRLFVPRNGTFPVGFAGDASKRSLVRLDNFAMICHPIAKAEGAGLHRITGPPVTTFSRDPLATEYLWKNELPPPELHIERLFEDPIFRTPSCSLESLVFGTCDADLAKMTAIGVDAWQQGIEVVYTDGSRRGIGPGRVAMQYHSIDGPGGERIIACYPRRDPSEDRMSWWSLRFITNRNRHFIFGDGPFDSSDTDRLPRKENHGRILMGLYGHWGRISGPKLQTDVIKQLQAIGGFSAYHDKFIRGDMLTDEADRFWCPSPPRGVQRLIGPVFGDPVNGEQCFNNKDESELSDYASVAWFDCSRPLKSIRVTFCHTSYEQRMPMASLVFNYSDGTSKSIGPTEFNPAQDPGFWREWCPCRLRPLAVPAVMIESPHYKHFDWDLNGAYLTGFTVYTGKYGDIERLRFLASDGSKTDTPGYRSGYKEEKHTVEFKDIRDGFSPALKVWYDHDGGVFFGARIIAAIQVMEIEKGRNDESFSGIAT